MIDDIINRLRAFDDLTLRRDIEGNAEKMMELVRRHFHCG